MIRTPEAVGGSQHKPVDSLWPSDAYMRQYICASTLIVTGADNDLSPDRHQAIFRTNSGILLIVPLEANFGEILMESYTFSFRKGIWKCCLENGGHFVSASTCLSR